jgi:HPt (histidine-containing phosphotransfer) domain-containing protein
VDAARWEKGKSMSRSVIDLEELLARVENDRPLMRDLILIFKEEFPRHAEALREAVASQDTSGVAAAAHTLKGMLSNMAAGEAATAAACLERLGRDGEIAKFAASLAQFEKLAEQLTRQLDSCLDEASA